MIEKLYIYHARSATREQIEVCKEQLCDEWRNMPIKLIQMPLFSEHVRIYEAKIPMKQRGLNLLNKK
jgi:hypothetical protein